MGSGVQHLEAKPLTAPQQRARESSCDPRAGSQARRCGARFGNGVGEPERTPTTATVADNDVVWAGETAQGAEKPAEATTTWTPLETVSMRSANQVRLR